MLEQITMFDCQDSACSKMFPDCSPPTMAKTSGLSSKKWQGSRKTGFMCLIMSVGGGVTQELLSATASQSPGEFTTVVTGERPREGNASLFSPISMDYLPRKSCLSEILEEHPDPKYNLSPKACLGILRRAVRRDKIAKMPEILVKALEKQAGVTLSEIILTDES